MKLVFLLFGLLLAVSSGAIALTSVPNDADIQINIEVKGMADNGAAFVVVTALCVGAGAVGLPTIESVDIVEDNPPHSNPITCFLDGNVPNTTPYICSEDDSVAHRAVRGYTWSSSSYHNAQYKVRVEASGRFVAGENENGPILVTISRKNEKSFSTSNLVITGATTTDTLIWHADTNKRKTRIPLSFTDAWGTANTSYQVFIYPADNLGSIVKSIEGTMSDSPEVVWDGSTNQPGVTAPYGIYTYNVILGNVEKIWSSEWTGANCGATWPYDPQNAPMGDRDRRIQTEITTKSYTDYSVTPMTSVPAGDPAPESGRVPFKIKYQFASAVGPVVTNCGIVVYDPDLNEVARKDGLPVIVYNTSNTGNTPALNEARVDVPLPAAGDYWFVLYAMDSNKYNKGHVSKPLIEQAVKWRINLSALNLESGGAVLDDGPNIPANTHCCAAVKPVEGDAGYVTLKAVLIPDITPYVPQGLTWSGGEEVPNEPLKRRVSKSAWVKQEVKATFGADEKKILVYVIGAANTGFSPANGTSGSNYSNDSYQWNNTYTNLGGNHPGIFGPFPQMPEQGMFHFSLCQIEFRTKPDELYIDGNNGIFSESDVKWQVSRDIMARVAVQSNYDPKWYYITNESQYKPDNVAGDNNPWDGQGYVYGNDFPFAFNLTYQYQPVTGQISGYNAREYVKAWVNSESPQICSTYVNWHCYRKVALGPNGWQNDGSVQEIKEGEMQW